ncbi:DUF2382 domain-containing protein [Faunimonas sp. B44]|uniref:DUF2382 domain-containing protein n=1 Tax=Faunimonas sp. B44 TaxID=3461493 RepID=UPI004043BE7B
MAPDAVSSPDNRVIPIVEEQAVILKRETLTEGVRVRTVVREQEAVIEEPIAIETIEVERVPLDRWGRGSGSGAAGGRYHDRHAPRGGRGD